MFGGLIKAKEKKDAPAMDYKAKTYKKGILTKEGGNFRTMKKRYFIAKRDTVFYYELPKNFNEATADSADELQFTRELCCGVFNIIGASIAKSDKKKLSMLIQPKNDKRSYLLCASSDKDLAAWIDLLVKLSNPNFKDEPIANNNNNTITPAAVSSPSTPKLGDSPKSISKNASFLDSPKVQQQLQQLSVNSPIPSAHQSPALKPSSPTVLIGNNSGSFREFRSPVAEPLGSDSPRSLGEPSTPLNHHHHHHHHHHHQDDNNENDDHHHDSQLDTDASDDFNRRQPLLSEEDELDIALCSAEIFLKSEADRTPEEQAYIMAMQQYRQNLKEHCKKQKGVPEYGLASGSLVFTVPVNERSEVEQEFVRDISELYVREIMAEEMERFNFSIELQAAIVKRAAEIFNKYEQEETKGGNNDDNEKKKQENDENSSSSSSSAAVVKKSVTAQERAYVEAIRRTFTDLVKIEHKHGLQMQHSLLSSTLMLSQYTGSLNEAVTGSDLGLDHVDYFNEIKLME